MHVISRKPISDFIRKHPQSARSLETWWTVAEEAAWGDLTEVKAAWPSADYVRPFTVFNISGNKYRLITRINYEQQRVYVRAVRTHAEYDKDRWKAQ